MINSYEAPEILKLGKAQDVIQDQKQLDSNSDWLNVPYRWEAPTIDDFDE